jgi:exodeoxyribonuclease VII small subunit
MTKNNVTIQDNMRTLDELLQWFESDDFSLEASIEKFKEAEALAKVIDTQLTEIKNDITVLKQSFDEV